MKAVIFYTLFVIAFILVTFFGLGPVLMADGSPSERGITLVIVILIYVILIMLFRYVKKRII
jgi:hypothetical protein